MDNILSNSLNKKILALVIILLIAGFTTQTFQQNSNNNKSKVYMHEAEQNPAETLILKTPEQESHINMQFLPVQEVEQVLQDYKYEKLYVETDPNFDTKVGNIEKYLSRRGAPLSEKARFFVVMANKFEIDYRLLPAISIIESSGGLKLYRRYNAWGWGGSKGFHFENWEHSIYVVSKGMARYYAFGAVTPEQMAPRYNPHTPNEWGAKVRMVMNQIGPEL